MFHCDRLVGLFVPPLILHQAPFAYIYCLQVQEAAGLECSFFYISLLYADPFSDARIQVCEVGSPCASIVIKEFIDQFNNILELLCGFHLSTTRQLTVFLQSTFTWLARSWPYYIYCHFQHTHGAHSWTNTWLYKLPQSLLANTPLVPLLQTAS